MPEWASALLKDALAPTGIVALGLGWWFKTRRDDKKEQAAAEAADRKSREDAAAAEKRSLQERAEKLEAKVESLLMDANAYLRETDVLRAERIVTDKQMVALATAMITALERAEAIAAKLLKDAR